MAGYAWVAAADAASVDGVGYSAAIVAVSDDHAGFTFVRDVRSRTSPPIPALLVIGGSHLAELDAHHDHFEDFCVAPFHPVEFDARLKHLLAVVGVAEARGDLLVYEGLQLNLETYQAVIDGRPLDLTYMEYELLKFLVGSPGRVFTREALLSQVWGYEYYGGARTVDVHIRRLRAKLGEEHAGLIQTVRSVGYRFGSSRWSSS